MEKRTWNLQMLIPLITAIFAVVFIVVGIKNFGFWTNQPTAAFFPIIIAVVLLASSLGCLVQLSKPSNAKAVRYNRNELMVILGGAAIILCTLLIGLVPSCLLYIFLWLKFIEHAPWKAIIVIEIIMAAIILGVFVSWLQVRFPMGLLENFL